MTRRKPRTPWQRLIVAAHNRPLVTANGEERRLIGVNPKTGIATVLRAGRHQAVPASAINLPPRTR